jgi:hypothetical protein
MVAKLHAIKAELRLRMHEPIADAGAWLRKVVNGYYGVALVNAAPSGIGSSRSLCSGFQPHAFCIVIL